MHNISKKARMNMSVVLVVGSPFLGETLHNKMGLVVLDEAAGIHLELVDEHGCNDVSSDKLQAEVPGLVVDEGEDFIIGCLPPFGCSLQLHCILVAHRCVELKVHKVDKESFCSFGGGRSA